MYNKKARDAGIEPEKMMAFTGDLVADERMFPDLHGFDIVVVSMALHHVEDPAKLLSELVRRLKPGGVVVALDWAPSDGGTHGAHGNHDHGHAHGKLSFAAHTIHREDLSPQTLFAWFRDAGCDLSGAYYVVVGEASHIPENVVNSTGGVWKNLFLAYARKD